MDANKTLLQLRVVWAALLAGQIFFMLIVAFLVVQNSKALAFEVGQIVGLISLIGIFTLLPVGFFLRMQNYKSGWQNDAVTPQAYFLGNLLLLIFCDAVSVTSLVGTLLTGSLLPLTTPQWSVGVLPALFSMVVQVFNFPTGKPMFPAINPFSPQSVTKPFDGNSQL